MSKLSRLERDELFRVYEELVPVINSIKENSDAIDDFLFKQFTIITENLDDAETLNMVRDHFEKEKDAVQKCFDLLKRLAEHFDCGG